MDYLCAMNPKDILSSKIAEAKKEAANIELLLNIKKENLPPEKE
jgi:hypothetical protein